MGTNSIRRRVGVTGLAALMLLGGCSSVRAIGLTGAGLRAVGTAADVAGAQTAGGALGVMSYLLRIGNAPKGVSTVGAEFDLRGTNSFVAESGEINYRPDGTIDVPRGVRTISNLYKHFDPEDDVVVGVDTSEIPGQVLEIELLRKKPYEELSGFERNLTGNPYKSFRKHRHTVGAEEGSYVWDPFSDGENPSGEFIMLCRSNGSMGMKPMGVDLMVFDGKYTLVGMSDGTNKRVRKGAIQSFR